MFFFVKGLYDKDYDENDLHGESHNNKKDDNELLEDRYHADKDLITQIMLTNIMLTNIMLTKIFGTEIIMSKILISNIFFDEYPYYRYQNDKDLYEKDDEKVELGRFQRQRQRQ